LRLTHTITITYDDVDLVAANIEVSIGRLARRMNFIYDRKRDGSEHGDEGDKNERKPLVDLAH